MFEVARPLASLPLCWLIQVQAAASRIDLRTGTKFCHKLSSSEATRKALFAAFGQREKTLEKSVVNSCNNRTESHAGLACPVLAVAMTVPHVANGICCQFQSNRRQQLLYFSFFCQFFFWCRSFFLANFVRYFFVGQTKCEMRLRMRMATSSSICSSLLLCRQSL